MCCSSWGRKESDPTERLNWDAKFKKMWLLHLEVHTKLKQEWMFSLISFP